MIPQIDYSLLSGMLSANSLAGDTPKIPALSSTKPRFFSKD